MPLGKGEGVFSEMVDWVEVGDWEIADWISSGEVKSW